MKVIIKIAWRNIWRNRVRSLVIIVSIVLGLWAGTFVSALYYGMGEDRVTIAIENEISHIQIHNPAYQKEHKPGFYINYTDTVAHALQTTPGIKAWSVRSKAQGMITSTTNSSGIYISGIDPTAEDSTTHLGYKIIEGHYFDSGKANEIIVGEKLAKRMKLKLKSKAVLTFTDKDENLAAGAFKVAGIFKSDNSSWDDANVFVKRQDLNALMNLDSSGAQEIAVLLNTNKTVDTTEAQLKKLLPQYKVESWMEIEPDINTIISVMSSASLVVIVIILMALSFGIINIMLMAVLERTRELGMMIALGMTRLRVFIMVVTETFFLVMLGCPVGLLVGFLTIHYLYVHGLDLSKFAGQSMSNLGFKSLLHPNLPFSQYEQIIVLVIITALLSAILPAVKAVRLNPAQTIKA